MWNTNAITCETPTLAPARAGCRPAFCRNRTLIAMDPIVGGDTRVANEPASWARTTRCRGSRSGTNPESDHAAAMNVSALRTSAAIAQPQFAVVSSVAKSTWASWVRSR